MPRELEVSARNTLLLALALALACTGGSKADASEEWFLGFVGQTGIEHCPKEFDDTKWLNVRSTLGFIPTSGASLEPWMGKPVLAKGQAIPDPPRKPMEYKPCPVMQMRGDWVNTPQGIRIDRQDHPAIEHFSVSSVEPLTGLSAKREGDEFTVSFDNPLPFDLAEMTMTVHYEGCYSKPGSMHQSTETQPMGTNTTVVEWFPIVAEEDGPPGERKGGPSARVHLAESLELSAKSAAGGPTLYVDLDVPLAALGVSLDCPERSK
jgi:hypothetical protein